MGKVTKYAKKLANGNVVHGYKATATKNLPYAIKTHTITKREAQKFVRVMETKAKRR